MHPILIEFLSFKLHTYGALMGIGFLTGMQLIMRRGKRFELSEKHLNQIILITFVSGIIGARLLYVMIDAPLDYLRHPWRIFMIWKGGLVFFGSFIVGLAAIYYSCRKFNLNHWQIFDLLSTPAILAHALGRLGCFMAGCCYGKVCHLPWAVTFTDPNGVGLKNVPLHPTQIYESLFLVALYFVLLGLRRFQRFHGFVFFSYLALYGIGRSLLELFRNDMRGGLLGLSTAQWISIPIIGFGLVMLVMKLRSRPLAQ